MNKEQYKNHIRQRLFEESPRVSRSARHGSEAQGEHNEVVAFLAQRHGGNFPHISGRGGRDASIQEIRDILDASSGAPFRRTHSGISRAISAMERRTIQGNNSLTSLIGDKYDIPGDASEHPHYDSLEIDNERDYIEELHNAAASHFKLK